MGLGLVYNIILTANCWLNIRTGSANTSNKMSNECLVGCFKVSNLGFVLVAVESGWEIHFMTINSALSLVLEEVWIHLFVLFRDLSVIGVVNNIVLYDLA